MNRKVRRRRATAAFREALIAAKPAVFYHLPSGCRALRNKIRDNQVFPWTPGASHHVRTLAIRLNFTGEAVSGQGPVLDQLALPSGLVLYRTGPNTWSTEVER